MIYPFLSSWRIRSVRNAVFQWLVALLMVSCTTESTAPPPVPNDGPDTTGHNFTWRIDTIGTRSTVLFDVAIIDENNIWVVGEIHTAETDTFDSLGNWIRPFNSANWNGEEWELIRVPAVTSYGSLSGGPINAVFAFSADDIWMFSRAGSYVHGNGISWESEYVSERVGSIKKIWGLSSQNLYFVGTNGNITYYDGVTWQRIESGTNLHFQDIWGAWNEAEAEWEILAVASRPYENYDRLIVQLSETSVSVLSDSSIDYALRAVWFSPGTKYYVAGCGIYEKNALTQSMWQNEPLDITEYTIFGLRGNHLNDIAAAGGVGEVLHFNGNSWKSYFASTGLGYGNYYAVDMKDDVIVAVGDDVPRGIITTGRRNP